MQRLLYYLLGLSIFSCQSAIWAGDENSVHAQSPKVADDQVRRNYLNTSRYIVSSHALVLEGSPQQIMRLSRWLDEIDRIPVGRMTLEAILESGNQLTIRHSVWALQASGRTLAPVSDKLTNGQGADIEILFDARIPEEGSHFVFDAKSNAIEFTAVQNLFHELVHAKHLANGTWRYFDSEGQAIEEENIFRAQHSDQQGVKQVPLRAAVDGEQIWWPAD
jgi:Effector protein